MAALTNSLLARTQSRSEAFLELRRGGGGVEQARPAPDSSLQSKGTIITVSCSLAQMALKEIFRCGPVGSQVGCPREVCGRAGRQGFGTMQNFSKLKAQADVISRLKLSLC